MDGTKFTPGPWAECKDGNCSCGYVFGAGGEVYVAKLLTLDDEVDPVAAFEQLTANAHLIAAAPELYEALAAMVARYASTDAWEVPMDCDVAARAALAKARGEPRPTKTEGEG